MKFSEQWLRQWVNPKLTTHELTEQMAMLGLTVDAVTPVAGSFSNVVIGEIISAIQHPNAERLRCCEVNVGAAELLKIVCGASNARAGIKVAVAKIGAVLPGDFQIKEAKLRGELSQGMLCSAKELQLQMGQSIQDGIIELPQDAKIGDDFSAYFKAQDYIIDVEITPNRGDCLSIRGVARDIAVANQLKINKPDREAHAKARAHVTTNFFPISVSAKTDCPRYAGRVIRNVNNMLEIPSFMQHCLQRAGIRLINPVVDVCNFVMLELGQPMHAFDLSTLQGKINVRRAENNETIKLLDDSNVKLTSDDLVIADDHHVHALAGIMGGIDSSVSSSTKDIFLEAAFFLPKTICLSKRRHNINSDSSYRFERGADFNLPVDAIERATELLLEMIGGEPAEIIEIVSTENLPSREKIILKRSEINRILGINVPDEKVESILKSLGMSINKINQTLEQENSHSHCTWEVIPPSFRFDMTLPIDLIEELARMTGYNAVTPQKMIASLNMSSQSEASLSDKRIRQLLVDRGYHEAMTYSFIEPSLHALFSPDLEPMTLQNPLSQDMSVMRTSIWPGLMQALQMNLRHQCNRVRLFEMGLCFEREQSDKETRAPASVKERSMQLASVLLRQTQKLAIAITGSVNPEQWSSKEKSADFYDLKADISALLAVSKSEDHFSWQQKAHPALHPGRSSALMRDEKIVGWLGEIHPHILTHCDIRQSVIVFEVDLDAISALQLPRYETFSRFPLVRRDLAVVLDEAINADTLCAVIAKEAGAYLQTCQVFDVYQGNKIELGKKSIALGLTFQDPSRTLRDEEINEVIQCVVAALDRELNATLRE